MFDPEILFKANIVQLILLGKVEEALQKLGSHYGAGAPRLRVGMPKGHRSKVGCYVSKTKTIYVANQEKLRDPFIIVHEFYHHLRTRDGKHRGTEKNANQFALEFTKAYRKYIETAYFR